ncbi:MAG: biotin/lipoyl-binding protein [Candidatus Paceibacterota bacterium]|jgi:HlyD family secretion protein
MKKAFNRVKIFASKHKVASGTIAIIVVILLYVAYHALSNTSTLPQYSITKARTGTITQTITGTGQISALRQLDLTSQASGKVLSIKVKVGDRVHKSDLIATIDSTDFAFSLQSAKLSMEKLIQPPKATDLSSAENTLTKTYDDTFNTISSTFLDLPDIMSGMKDLLYGQGTCLSDQQSPYLISSAREYRDQAGQNYDKANKQYTSVLSQYKNINRSSATSSIEKLLADTYSMSKSISTALQNMQNTINYIITVQPEYQSSLASSATSNVTSWSNTMNSNVSGLLSAQNTIQSNKNSLANLINGVNPLDLESQKLSLKQQELNYQNYFVRSPFDGIVGRIPIRVYDEAGGGTVIATILSDQKIASISLNEIDAAKVKVGQNVDITFDAIDSLIATGTVSEVDLVGTVSQGVVSYGVKIAVNSIDPRILSGMSVNTTIITNEKNGVIVVPSSAVKTQGRISYVQVFDNPVLPTLSDTAPLTASTSRAFIPRSNTSSTTNPNRISSQNRTVSSATIYSATIPRDVTVTIGDTDDTNTEIITGLSEGEWVITRTVSGSSSQTTTVAPSILNTLGGSNRSATGGTFRTISR